MGVDTANRYFQGKENVAIAIARRKIKAGGDVKAMTERAAFPVHSTRSSVTTEASRRDRPAGGSDVRMQGDGGHGTVTLGANGLPAAADVENGPGDIGRAVATQPGDRRGHFLRLADALHRDLGA